MSESERLTPQSFLPLTPVVFQILLALTDQERHGYGIMKEVSDRTDGSVTIRPGTLYRAVSRLLTDRLIEESETRPDPEEDDERRRYYRLMAFGRQVAEAEARRMEVILHSAYSKSLLDAPGKS